MIYSSIIEHFRELDSIVESCNALKEAKKEYYQALNEEHLNLDIVRKLLSKFQQTTQEKKAKVDMLLKDINGLNCDGYNTLEPLTIGIFAEWGAGKTHLLKGVKNKIKDSQNFDIWQNTPKQFEKIDKIVIPISFNAWRFEKEEHIIIPLFQTMISELNNYNYISRAKILKQKLTILSLALITNLQLPKGFDFTKVLSGDFSSLKDVASFFNFKGVLKSFKEKEDEDNPQKQLEELLKSGYLNSIYIKIPEWIEKITIYDDVRFVFLIDDLDRCLPENTLKMLESIKLFLDVAGCSFVLAIDDDVVERGVEHHYRDYIQKNTTTTYINCKQRAEEKDKQNKETSSTTNGNYNQEPDKKAILPITGNEYLEKMVQLPFRIPPIDTQDVREFLTTRYKRFQNLEEYRNIEEKAIKSNPNRELLEFFVKTTPYKPRKIKRVIALFEAKEKLSQRLRNINHILLAKLTLLELFAPKLFRFMQLKGFVRLYKRLVKWQEEHNTLSQFNAIKQDILNSNLPDIDRFLFLELQEIIESLYKSRIEFNLDNIFNEDIDETTLKEHLFFKNYKIAIKEPQKQKETQPQDIELFFKRLLSNDTLLWRDAFSEDSNLKDINAILDNQTFNTLLEKLKNKQELVNTPGWLELVAEHLSNTQLLKLIKTYNPFKDIS